MKRFAGTTFAFLVGYLLCPIAAGQQAPVLATVHDSMARFVDSHDLAGAVTMVVKENQTVHLDAVGWAHIESSKQMRTDTLFSVASMTKPITAAGVLILCDEGKIGLDDPIIKHLPEFDHDRLKEITLRHLLTHTSGIIGNQMVSKSLEDHVASIARQPLAFGPGEKWAYGPGISVAGQLIEVVSGMPYDTFLQKRIFEPLGMNDSTFHPTGDWAGRVAAIYNKGGTTLKESSNVFLGPVENRPPNPSGGLYSTAHDISRFYRMLLNHGELDGKRILSERLAKEMTTPQTGEKQAGFVPGSQWGLGVGMVQSPTGVTAMLHPGTFGHGGLYGTQVWADPTNQTIYILLIQRLGLINADASPMREAFQSAAARALD